VGSGANGPILIALGARPLRTKRLTQRVAGYAPRTIYRHLEKLSELGLLDRQEGAGVPSTVVYGLSKSEGRDLYRLLDSYARAALPQAGGRIDHDFWRSLALLGEMWASGWVEMLSRGARSPTDLSESTMGLTFHQVNRRMHLLTCVGLLGESTVRGRGKRYQLTPQARRAMALIAAIGRWRQRHVLREREMGLTVPEMATVLRTSLPLVELAERQGMSIKLGVVGTMEEKGENGSDVICGKVSRMARVRTVQDPGSVDAWALGTVDTWLAATLDGDRSRMRVGGDLELVESCLRQLHAALWNHAESEQTKDEALARTEEGDRYAQSSR
jgi:DNA-binding HxlR family transcriptional regulator